MTRTWPCCLWPLVGHYLCTVSVVQPYKPHLSRIKHLFVFGDGNVAQLVKATAKHDHVLFTKQGQCSFERFPECGDLTEPRHPLPLSNPSSHLSIKLFDLSVQAPSISSWLQLPTMSLSASAAMVPPVSCSPSSRDLQHPSCTADHFNLQLSHHYAAQQATEKQQ